MSRTQTAISLSTSQSSLRWARQGEYFAQIGFLWNLFSIDKTKWFSNSSILKDWWSLVVKFFSGYFKNINLCHKVEIAKKDLNTIFNKINKSLSDLEAVGHSQTEEIPNNKTNFKEKTEVSFEVNKNMKLQRDDIEDSRQSLQFSSSSNSNVQ